MKKPYRFWTTKEAAYLREHYPREGAKKVGEVLGRDCRLVQAYASQLGVKMLNQVGGTQTLATLKARCDIDKTDDDSCWIWTGRFKDGIPQAHHDGMMVSARQVMWKLAGKPTITGAEVVRVRCDDPRCLNPDHLVAVPRATLLRQNAAKEPAIRRTARLRQAAIDRGHAKLTEALAAEIRMMPGPARDAAKLTGVSESNINRVRRGEAWKDLSTFGSERMAGAGAGR